MIIGTRIYKNFDGTPILEDTSFKVGGGKKVGIVGKNGCGKTTLFKIIQGIEQVNDGSVQVQQETIGVLPQEFSFPDKTVGEYLTEKLENDWESYKIDMLVDELKFENYDADQKLNLLSEGQQMKVRMIEMLLSDPTILLIDEPTNHLDIEGIVWFENYVKKLEQTVVIISHDREFLNNVVDEIWEIENKKIIRFIGNYDTYKEEKLKLIGKWDQEYKLFLNKKAKLEKLLLHVRSTGGGKKKGRAVQAAKKRIIRETEGENEKFKYKTRKMGMVRFETEVTHNKHLVDFLSVTKKYGEKTLFKDLSFAIQGGEKTWMFGPNGVGKSTILKMIMGHEEVTNGEIKIGDNVRIGYFAQKENNLNKDKNILDQFIEETGCSFGDAYATLNRFMFDKNDVKKALKNLSPGQRARYAFAIFAHNDYDLLILDEPTNHLDIETKEVIEDSLRSFKGAVFLVSHDRFFVERVGIDKVYNLKEGRMVSY